MDYEDNGFKPLGEEDELDPEPGPLLGGDEEEPEEY